MRESQACLGKSDSSWKVHPSGPQADFLARLAAHAKLIPCKLDCTRVHAARKDCIYLQEREWTDQLVAKNNSLCLSKKW